MTFDKNAVDPDQPVLYILMRTDLDSMNPGKAIAQACHAQSMLSEQIRLCEANTRETAVEVLYKEWSRAASSEHKTAPFEDQTYGTTIVLDAKDEETIVKTVAAVKLSSDDCLTGIVIDPSYPVKDGAVTHLIPLVTCAYVFGARRDVSAILSQFELHY